MRSRLIRRALLAILLGAGPVLAVHAIPEAAASTVAQLSTDQLTDASTYIVRGTVTRVWTETDADGVAWTRAEIAVARVLKGPDTPDTLVVDTMGTSQAPVAAAARFSEGEELLVFLDRISGDRLTPVSMFWGKLTVRRAPGDDRHHLVRWHGRPGERFDARFLPHPAPEERVWLDDTIDTIESRLDVGWDGRPVPGLAPERLQQINTLEYRRRR